MAPNRIEPGVFIVAPTTYEFNAVNQGLGSYLQGGEYRLLQCGMGEEQSSAFCARLDGLSITRLVLVGWAGGLSHDLKVGDLLYADRALHAGQPSMPCALPGTTLRCGPILTVHAALMTPGEKQAALESGALAVEMEAYPLAAWASRHGIPFLHGRVISDTCDETLPDVEMDTKGRPLPIALLKRLARHPAMLGELARFGRRIQALNPLLVKLAISLASS